MNNATNSEIARLRMKMRRITPQRRTSLGASHRRNRSLQAERLEDRIVLSVAPMVPATATISRATATQGLPTLSATGKFQKLSLTTAKAVAKPIQSIDIGLNSPRSFFVNETTKLDVSDSIGQVRTLNTGIVPTAVDSIFSTTSPADDFISLESSAPFSNDSGTDISPFADGAKAIDGLRAPVLDFGSDSLDGTSNFVDSSTGIDPASSIQLRTNPTFSDPSGNFLGSSIGPESGMKGTTTPWADSLTDVRAALSSGSDDTNDLSPGSGGGDADNPSDGSDQVADAGNATDVDTSTDSGSVENDSSGSITTIDFSLNHLRRKSTDSHRDSQQTFAVADNTAYQASEQAVTLARQQRFSIATDKGAGRENHTAGSGGKTGLQPVDANRNKTSQKAHSTSGPHVSGTFRYDSVTHEAVGSNTGTNNNLRKLELGFFLGRDSDSEAHSLSPTDDKSWGLESFVATSFAGGLLIWRTNGRPKRSLLSYLFGK